MSSTGSVRSKRARLIGLGLIALALLGVGAWLGPDYIRGHQHRRYLEQGRKLAGQGDLQGAGLYLRKAILKRPKDPEAYRLMADLAQRSESPTAAAWLAKVVELNPTDVEARLEWADASLRVGDPTSAQRALAGVSEPDAGHAVDFQRLSGTLALTLNQRTDAELHLVKALELQPTNLITQLNLNALRLASTNRPTAELARAELNRLATNPAVRVHCLRHLIHASLGSKDAATAVRLAEDLVREPKAEFQDGLLRLRALHAAGSRQLEVTIAATQQTAADHPQRVFSLGQWLLSIGQGSQALTWIRSLPPAVQTNQPIPLLTVECLAASSNYPGIVRFLDTQNWGSGEFYRFAMKARACRDLNDAVGFEHSWRQALTLASKATGPQPLARLAKLTHSWRWPDELEDTLMALMEQHPRERWALQDLTTLYHARGKTAPLRQVLSRQLAIEPTNTMVMNNLAMTLLLLDAEDRRAHDLARKVREAQPDNPTFCSTYAFSLHCQRKTAQAIELMQALPPNQLANPSVAAYYGILLAASGRGTDATHYLDLAGRAHLLPEEAQLIQKARSSIR